MTQDQKDLLLKDLCARLYTCNCINGTALIVALDDEQPLESNQWLISNYDCYKDKFIVSNIVYASDVERLVDIDNIRPYLFPLSSMTDELWDKEFMGYGITEFTRDSFKYGCETLEFNNDNPHLSSMVRFINQLIKNHFDIYGLIPMGLANDATGLNIY